MYALHQVTWGLLGPENHEHQAQQALQTTAIRHTPRHKQKRPNAEEAASKPQPPKRPNYYIIRLLRALSPAQKTGVPPVTPFCRYKAAPRIELTAVLVEAGPVWLGVFRICVLDPWL